MSIIRTGQRILVELRDLVNSVIIFQTILLRWLTFLLGFQTDFHSRALLDLFLSSDTSIWFTIALSLHCEILIRLLSQFLLTFHQIHKKMPHFIAWLMTILVLVGWHSLGNHLTDVTLEEVFILHNISVTHKMVKKVIANLNLSKASGDCWKVLSVGPVFKNVGKGLELKTTVLLVFFLWLEVWPFFWFPV